jgi:phosphate-selective porin OprO and OprP
MTHQTPTTPFRSRLAVPALAALSLLSATAADAAKDPVRIRTSDGITFRGDGWRANLGGSFMMDFGEQVSGPGTSDDFVWRRVRPNLTLDLSPQWSARLEYEMGDIAPGFRNAWVQWRPMDRLSIRVGSQFAPFGLENTMSARDMPWIERSSVNALTPAALIGASFRTRGDRWTLSGGVYGNDIADDDRRRYAGSSLIGRGTWVPVREDGWLWHVGLSGEHRDGSSDGTLRLRARPESLLTDTRLVDTGLLPGVDSLQTVVFETALRRGPWLVMAEYLQATAARRTGAGPDGGFDGGYVSAAWMLTGERREYSEAAGVFGGVRPKSRLGALELAARVSYLDLDDGRAIRGGRQESLSLNLNWYYDRFGRVSLSWVDTASTRRGIDRDRGYLTLRAQVAF